MKTMGSHQPGPGSIQGYRAHGRDGRKIPAITEVESARLAFTFSHGARRPASEGKRHRLPLSVRRHAH